MYLISQYNHLRMSLVGHINNATTSDSVIYDILYIASVNDQLCSAETDAQCMIIAYDEPIEAIKHFHDRAKCTLFAIKWCDMFTKSESKGSKKYIYIGPGRSFEIVQKITLSPINYLQDWCQMNRLVNYTI